ncbi:ATP-binding protein [Pseudoalteromonas rubra]|uniref:histidine kinase n=1 Tax=Pseudoalteromonas rubra TaxID=43658 RepID=A0A5S3WLA4_9GAMM|nr:ATP-binding protein [Pseudoalteromonas rubra]TMP28515.1 ATP-binding protein [Pseudoalteromonas rubra]TMP30482.1 ATP-binding protein [Pseudoalteromonas rubra]
MIKLNYERLVSGFCLIVWLLFALLSTALLLSLGSGWLGILTNCVVVLCPAALLLHSIKTRVVQPFYHLTNTVEAMRLEDYGQRFYTRDQSGILAQLQTETSQLCEHLQAYKSARDHQAILLFQLIEQLPSPIVVFDESNALVHANEAFSNWTGKPWQTQRLTKAHHFSLVQSNGQWQFSHPSLAQQWQIRQSQLPINDSHAHLLILTDVQSVVSQAQRDAWQKMIRILSHEIHNSLSPIKSLAQTLQTLQPSKDTQADFEQALMVIVQRSDGLMSFVNRYASVARQHQLHPKVITISALLTPMQALYEPRVCCKVEQEFTLPVDVSLMEQVLINLITNALEASAQTAAVKITASKTAQYAFIDILDEGQGISNPDNLFVPFYTIKANGKGIGLVLCKNIIEQHNGRLTLVNRTDKPGARARIQLPLAQS